MTYITSQPIQYGWQCPFCKSVYSPSTISCGCQVEVFRQSKADNLQEAINSEEYKKQTEELRARLEIMKETNLREARENGWKMVPPFQGGSK